MTSLSRWYRPLFSPRVTLLSRVTPPLEVTESVTPELGVTRVTLLVMLKVPKPWLTVAGLPRLPEDPTNAPLGPKRNRGAEGSTERTGVADFEAFMEGMDDEFDMVSAFACVLASACVYGGVMTGARRRDSGGSAAVEVEGAEVRGGEVSCRWPGNPPHISPICFGPHPLVRFGFGAVLGAFLGIAPPRAQFSLTGPGYLHLRCTACQSGLGSTAICHISPSLLHAAPIGGARTTMRTATPAVLRECAVSEPPPTPADS